MDASFLPHKTAILENLPHLDALNLRWQEGFPGQPELLELSGQLSQLTRALPQLQAFAQQFRLEPADIQYLGGLQTSQGRNRYPESFINYLQRQSFSFEWVLQTKGTKAPALLVKGPAIALELLQPALNLILDSAASN
jgi:nicotinic acid phosphoribosyltransferase